MDAKRRAKMASRLRIISSPSPSTAWEYTPYVSIFLLWPTNFFSWPSGRELLSETKVCRISYGGAVDQALKVAAGEPADGLMPNPRLDFIAPAARHLAAVAVTGGGLLGFEELRIKDRDLCGGIYGGIIQPGVRLGVGLPLAGAAGLCAGKGFALPVLLHVDLPALAALDLLRRVLSLAHTKTPFGYRK